MNYLQECLAHCAVSVTIAYIVTTIHVGFGRRWGFGKMTGLTLFKNVMSDI